MKTLTEKMAEKVTGMKKSVMSATKVLDRHGKLTQDHADRLFVKFRRLNRLEQYLEERAWR